MVKCNGRLYSADTSERMALAYSSACIHSDGNVRACVHGNVRGDACGDGGDSGHVCGGVHGSL